MRKEKRRVDFYKKREQLNTITEQEMCDPTKFTGQAANAAQSVSKCRLNKKTFYYFVSYSTTTLPVCLLVGVVIVI